MVEVRFVDHELVDEHAPTPSPELEESDTILQDRKEQTTVLQITI
jgi:hypothetical protein